MFRIATWSGNPNCPTFFVQPMYAILPICPATGSFSCNISQDYKFHKGNGSSAIQPVGFPQERRHPAACYSKTHSKRSCLHSERSTDTNIITSTTRVNDFTAAIWIFHSEKATFLKNLNYPLPYQTYFRLTACQRMNTCFFFFWKNAAQFLGNI